LASAPGRFIDVKITLLVTLRNLLLLTNRHNGAWHHNPRPLNLDLLGILNIHANCFL